MKSTQIPRSVTMPFAMEGTRSELPDERKPGMKENEASYKTGFPEITMTPSGAGGLPPLGADMNKCLYDTTDNIRWYSAGMWHKFDQAFSDKVGGYPKGAILQKADLSGLWQSLVEDNGENPDLAGGAPYYWKDALINMDELRRTFVAKEGDTMSGKLTIASSSGYQLELKDDGDNVNLLTFTDQKGASEGYLGIDNTRADFVMRNDRANAEMRIKSTEVTYSVSGMTAALLRTGDITGSAWRNPRSSSLKDYIDTAVSSIDLTDYVKKSGDTMTGPLTIAPHSKPLVLQHWGTGTAVNWTSDIDTVQAYVGYPDASTARFEISSQGTTLSLSDGRIDASTHFMCNGEVYAGESYMTRNGNIYGNVWREFGNATNARDAVRWVYES